MTNYQTQADKAVKKFDEAPKDLKKDAASMAGNAQSFLKDAKSNVGEIASDAKKHIRDDIEKATAFVKDNPAKGTLYALGIGAALAYFLLPRRK